MPSFVVTPFSKGIPCEACVCYYYVGGYFEFLPASLSISFPHAGRNQTKHDRSSLAADSDKSTRRLINYSYMLVRVILPYLFVSALSFFCPADISAPYILCSFMRLRGHEPVPVELSLSCSPSCLLKRVSSLNHLIPFRHRR